MRALRLLVMAAALGMAMPARAAAQPDAAALRSAATLVELLDLERTVDTMFVSMKGLFAENVIAAMERDAGQAGYVKTLLANGRGGRERFTQILGDEFVTALRSRYGDMKQVAAREYAGQFSGPELDGLVAFFQSGVGAKWRKTSPAIEATMGKWGESAGMQAGGVALVAALARADREMLGKGESQ